MWQVPLLTAGLAVVAGCSALPAGPSPGVLHVTVDPAAVAVQGFLGFGAERDPCPLNERTGPGRADWDRTCRRIEWMRPPIVRMMKQAKWCLTGEGRFDPDTAAMRDLYRHLDLCQRLGVTVVLTDWGVEPNWLQRPKRRQLVLDAEDAIATES